MKKAIFLILAAFISISPLFSQQETWFSMGFEFGNSFERTDNDNTYIGAPGFNLNGYSFSGKKDIGWFFHYSFLFPALTSGDGNISDYGLQLEFIIGPVFRYSINENLKLVFGAGIDWMPIFATYNQNISGDTIEFSKTASNFGIGADIGIKYDIKEYFYINGGLTVSYIFNNYTSIYSTRRISNNEIVQTQIYDGSINGYGMFTVKPYICIGINSYQEKVVLGKPRD
jgi:hypothetical protein